MPEYGQTRSGGPQREDKSLLPPIILQGTSAEFLVMQKLGLKSETYILTALRSQGPVWKEFNLTLKTEVSWNLQII